jgi:hypothetical protein
MRGLFGSNFLGFDFNFAARCINSRREAQRVVKAREMKIKVVAALLFYSVLFLSKSLLG